MATHEKGAKDATFVEDKLVPVISNAKAEADGNDNVAVVQTQDSRFATYLAAHPPNPLSKSLLLLYPILFVAFMNSAANGFDGNTFGGVSVRLTTAPQVLQRP